MAKTAGDVIVETLMSWGGDQIFGWPGGEETAAFAACAYAKVSERLGVCLATFGPGEEGAIEGCGHYLMEKRSGVVDCELLEFFRPVEHDGR